ncbi:MAG: TfoX/Sxy family protein [Planctomycetes bacterium]|nr:TfoX/Sxy family protein [Planctomycetota bacterium]
MPSANTRLNGLTNIGPTIAARLEAVGIKTVADLRRAGGPAGAYNLLKANSSGKTVPVCYYLYSLQGALDRVHWDALTKKAKRKLLRQIQ